MVSGKRKFNKSGAYNARNLGNPIPPFLQAPTPILLSDFPLVSGTILIMMKNPTSAMIPKIKNVSAFPKVGKLPGKYELNQRTDQ